MKLPIPAGTFRAYLFDCDGTVADSMPLHYVAWTTALGEWNCEFPEELFYAWGGKPPIEIVATLNKMRGLDMPASEVAEHKENLYFELAATTDGGGRSGGAHRTAVRKDSFCCCLGRHARFSDTLTYHAWPD